ncbi:MAG: hypothetical protein OHK0047_18540 [Leptolyngbyaceae cyanobacterium]
MHRKFFLALYSLVLILVLVSPQTVLGQMGWHPRMMGNRGMGMGGEGSTIHQLFAYHDQIHRSVEDIPGGIRAITESDNPQVAALIQSHVSRMYARLDQQDPIPMIGMSATLPKMMQAHQKYQRQLHKTAKGIEVIETAIDPNMVMVIRDHAREVTQFVEQGMPVMRNGRMRRYAQ